MTNLLKVGPKTEKSAQPTSTKPQLTKPFTRDQLEAHWNNFAAQRKKYQAEYQLLGQPFDLEETKIRLHLLSPVQETLLGNIKSELVTYLREQLSNDMINVTGEVIESDDRKIMYTSRDKFEYLQQKIPLLAELKERLGLDTDF